MIHISRKVEKVWYVIYRIVYEIIYYSFVSTVFGYAEFKWNPVTWKCILSYVVFFALLFLPEKKDRPSKYLLNVFFIFTIIPILSCCWMNDQSAVYMLMCASCYALLSLICSRSNNRKPIRIALGEYLRHICIEKVLFVAISLCIIGITVKYGMADSRALIMENVYDIRSSRSFTGIWGYIINWLPFSLVPCLICVGLYKKKYVLVLFGILVQLYIYMLTGSKSAFFSIGLIGYSYFILKKDINFSKWWCIALTALCIATPYIYIRLHWLLPFSIVPVRLLSAPASISFRHYTFFSQNPKLLMAENFIGRLLGIKSPYDMPASFIISGTSSNANTGYLGDAYDNGGIIVMIIYTIVLALILRYIDRIYFSNGGYKRSLPVYVGILTYSMLYINDGSLTALILTGGLIFNIIVLSQFRSWFDVEEISECSNELLFSRRGHQ